MREEGNIIILNKTEQYCSKYDNERYWLLSGGIQLFIVPWFDAEHTTDREAGRSVALREFSPEHNFEIPSFCYTDEASGNAWRFCLKATEENTKLEIRTNVTRLLKKNFLKEVGINSYEAEGGANGHGFENSLISYYKGHLTKETVSFYQGEINSQETRQENLEAIASGINGNLSMKIVNGSTLYRAVRYGAVKCGIDFVQEEDKVIAACAGKAFDVPDIARLSHFICRNVTLDMDWYKNDCGVIIAFLPVENGKETKGKAKTEKQPVVCYPKGGKYICYNGVTEKEQVLSKGIADQLEPKAYSIRRTLPNRKLTRKDMIRFVRKGIHGRDLFHLIFISLICTLLGVLLPKLNQLIYDEYIPMGDTDVIVQICFVIIACMIGKVFISIVKSLQEYRIPARSGYEMQDAFYHRIFELPENFFRNCDSAELANRISSVSGIVNGLVGKILSNGFALALSIIYWIQMIRYSGKLSLVSLIMLLIYGALIYFLSRYSLRYIRQIEEYKGEAASKLYQFISGVDKIRMAGAEERVSLEYSNPVVNEKRLTLRTGRNSALIAVLSEAGSTLFSMVLYFMMIRSQINISMGSFMAFTTAFASVSSATLGFVQAAIEYSQMKPIMKRLSPILEQEPEDNEEKEVITSLTGEIEVDRVTFAYQKDQQPVLNGVSLQIHPGEYIAVVGPSGCGKSTLLKLLLGFETPDQGRIKYDGKDIAAVNKHSLRKNVGVVLQNGKLIAGSIFENITITSNTPDAKKVWNTIDDVGLREDVDNMPMGIHTVLSESGGTISGGQQQRILIARAIYNDPAVLFFDEATSALDNLTQAKVCESLEKRRMTRMVIAHRLSTVKNCDRIFVMDHGTIIEEGNYEQLMALKGRFYEMATRQIA